MPAPTFRERHHGLIWAALWPVRMWFSHAPIHRGKGLLLRALILPALPPKPASFAYRLRGGERIDLFYREDMGTKVLFDGWYEDREIAELCALITPGASVIDVGANIGLSALELARAVGPDGAVIACEPHPDTMNRLRDNLARNGIKQVSLVQSAIGAKVGFVTFHQSAQPTLSSASMLPPDYERSFEVPATTLDTIWKSRGRATISALKIDVEGGELDVLRGAAELLADQRPAILLEAWGDAQLAPIADLLGGFGYRMTQPIGFAARNYLFVAD